MRYFICFPLQSQGTSTLDNQVDYSTGDMWCHYLEHEFWFHILRGDRKCFGGSVSWSSSVCLSSLQMFWTHNISQFFGVLYQFYWCDSSYTVDEEHGVFESPVPVFSNLTASHL